MRFDIIALAAVLAAPTALAQQHRNGNRPGAVATSSPVAAPAKSSPVNAAPNANQNAANKNTNGNAAAASPKKGTKTNESPSPASSPKAGSGNKASPSPTPAPATGSTGSTGGAVKGGAGAMTWNIVNKQGTPLSLVYGNNAGGPGPLGGAKDGMLASSTQIVFPSGWAGRVVIGPNGDTAGSKIEGSVMPQFNVDVSYVDGFTVPITCTDKKSGSVFIGCNIPLFSKGNKCEQQGPGPICYNTDVALHAFSGPPKAFFAPCQGAAYTFPKDDGADRVSTGPEIDCCVGAACPASVLQKGAKRELSNVERRWAYPRSVFEED